MTDIDKTDCLLRRFPPGRIRPLDAIREIFLAETGDARAANALMDRIHYRRRPRSSAGFMTVFADALVAAALKAADRAETAPSSLRCACTSIECGGDNPRIADPADADIAALLNGEPAG